MKKIFILLIIFLMVGCDNGNGDEPSPPPEPCVYTLNTGLSNTGYTGCWGDCRYGEINCLVVGVYADEDCTQMIEAISFLSPDVTPWEILFSVTREWPDEAWLLFYVSNCNRAEWYIPYFWDYYECQGPHLIRFYPYDCGYTITAFYSGINDIFDDSCIWGYY